MIFVVHINYIIDTNLTKYSYADFYPKSIWMLSGNLDYGTPESETSALT